MNNIYSSFNKTTKTNKINLIINQSYKINNKIYSSYSKIT